MNEDEIKLKIEKIENDISLLNNMQMAIKILN